MGQVVGRGTIYFLLLLPNVPIVTTTSVDLFFFLSPSSFYLWYSHLYHVSSCRLRFMASLKALENLQTCCISYCCGCKLTKFSALPFNRSIYVSSSPFDLIHSYVWGLSSIATKEES